MYQKFLIHIKILWYISKFYDTYQKFLMYQKFLIHISFFWYISEISDTYQNFRNFWYISDFSDTYQKFLIYIFLMIHIKILWYISEISDTYVFGCQNLIGIRISDTHQSWGHNMCKKVSNWVVLEAVFKLFYTYCAHSSVCTSCFSNMSWTIKQHASTSHLHMHFKTNLLSTQIPVKVGDFAQCMC